MDTPGKRAAKRLVTALLVAAGLGGCAVYAPTYAGYEPVYSNYGYTGYYGYPTYVAPPLALDFGFYEHRHHGGYHGKQHGHGWRGHGGSGHRGAWGHRGGRH